MLALKSSVEEVNKGRPKDESTAGLDPQLHAPFFDILNQERAKRAPVTPADAKWLADLTVDMVDRLIRDAVSNVGFWKSAPRQDTTATEFRISPSRITARTPYPSF